MRNFTTFVLLFLISTGLQSFSQNPNNNCPPPDAYAILDINNVNARINAGSSLWWDKQSTNYYEVPAGSGINSMYSATICMGGKDENNQLHFAGNTYHANGYDYYMGPVSNDGNLTIDNSTCSQYNQLFKINKQQVLDFIEWWNDKAAFPDYKVPDVIKNWPAHGDVSKNQSYYLAPFYDNNGDGKYNYNDGDYPYFDIKNELCGSRQVGPENNTILYDQVLKGDQSIFQVMNDAGNQHEGTGGKIIGLEIRMQAYAYETNDALNDATFYSYEIINRSTKTYSNFWFGLYTDCEVGYAYDDRIASDVARGLGYSYNGDDYDGPWANQTYGYQPPMVGIDFFQGLYMDADSIDNPMHFPDGSLICDVNINGQNFGDSIIDNERYGMRKFMYSYKFQSHWQWPQSASELFNMIRGIWPDGTTLQYGGLGHPLTSSYGPDCSFMFPENSDPCLWNTNGISPNGNPIWSEESLNHPAYDRQYITSTGPVTLKPGAVNYVTIGVPWARSSSGDNMETLELLRKADDQIQAMFDNCFSKLQGPHAPDLIVHESDNELIFYLTNRKISNNYQEKIFRMGSHNNFT
jgi:hypothetical protein